MKLKSPFSRAFLAAFLLLFTIVSNLSARPMPPLQANRFADTPPTAGALPPVNWIRSRSIDVKHIAIDLRFDWAKESAFGTTTVTLSSFTDTDRFYLDAAMLTINSVKLGAGADLKFNYDAKKDNDNLEILLDRTYKAGEDITVKIDYRTNYVNTADSDTAIGGFGRGLRFIKPTAEEPHKPRQIWSQGESEFNRYWFPSYDSPNDFRTTELRATVEKPFIVVSNGKLMETKDNGDNTRTFYWKMDTPYSNYLTSIVVGDFVEIKNGEYDGIPVLAYGYPSEAKEVAATTKNVPAMVKFFSEKTGVKYAYPKYSQAVVEDFGGGMENISATTQIEEMIHDEREMLDEDSDSLQSHELAHQWFGDYVTTREWGQIWLNESFATYFQGLWDEESKGHAYFLYSDIRKNHNDVLESWSQGNRRPIVTKYYANKDALFDNYAYPGGASVLHMLRKQLGDEAFFKSLNHYLTANAHQPVSTEELRIAIEETTGQSMDWFFDQWLYKMGHPVFEITKSYDAAAKKLTLNVKQVQKTDVANPYPQVQYFQSYVDVEIDNRIERVWLKPQVENAFTFDAPTDPKLVNFDYESTLLKEMTFSKPVDELIYQVRNDKDPLGRNWAMNELAAMSAGSPDKPKIIAALGESVTTDHEWFNRKDAIGAIAHVLNPKAESVSDSDGIKIDDATGQRLTAALKDEKAPVRSDAVLLLGATHDPKYADLYFAALNDKSYTVISNAAGALGVLNDKRAYDALTKLANTDGWHSQIKLAGINGLAALADKRSFDFAFKTANDKNQSPQVRSAALNLVAVTGKGDKRAYPLIFDAFKKAYDANDIQAVFNNLQVIVSLADPRGQEAFDLMKTKYKDNAQIMGYIAVFETQFKAAIK